MKLYTDPFINETGEIVDYEENLKGFVPHVELMKECEKEIISHPILVRQLNRKCPSFEFMKVYYSTFDRALLITEENIFNERSIVLFKERLDIIGENLIKTKNLDNFLCHYGENLKIMIIMFDHFHEKNNPIIFTKILGCLLDNNYQGNLYEDYQNQDDVLEAMCKYLFNEKLDEKEFITKVLNRNQKIKDSYVYYLLVKYYENEENHVNFISVVRETNSKEIIKNVLISLSHAFDKNERKFEEMKKITKDKVEFYYKTKQIILNLSSKVISIYCDYEEIMNIYLEFKDHKFSPFYIFQQNEWILNSVCKKGDVESFLNFVKETENKNVIIDDEKFNDFSHKTFKIADKVFSNFERKTEMIVEKNMVDKIKIWKAEMEEKKNTINSYFRQIFDSAYYSDKCSSIMENIEKELKNELLFKISLEKEKITKQYVDQFKEELKQMF